MMIARLGDQNSHGGVILTGSETKLSDGLPTARLGDTASCPLHGTNSIVDTIVTDYLIDGKPVATVGAIMACGAIIITGSEDILVG